MTKNDGIDFAIISFNENSSYSKLWPFVSQCWKQVCNITPIAFELSSESSDFQVQKFGIIKKVKLEKGYSPVFQSQLLRFFAIKLLDSPPNSKCILTDADMLPINSQYINTGLKFYQKDHIISYNKDLLSNQDKQIPVCYNLASINFFKKFFMLDNLNTFKKFLDFLTQKYSKEYGIKNVHKQEFGWDIDQRFLFDQMHQYKKNFIGLKMYSQINFKRLDRGSWPKPLNFKDISSGIYTDCHFHNSFSELSENSKELLSEIIKHAK